VLERDDVLPLILMVDDEPANLEAYLSNVPCDVMTAGDGQAALEAAARRTPDLVLLDIVMPRMDGFETCARLKADARNRLVPVVMITGMDDTKARVRALEAGADDFLSKPVEQIELVARVQSMLRLKSSYDQLDDAQHVIIALARAVEAKDTYTEAHTGRVAASGRALAEAAGVGGKELEAIYLGGIIHDIGKIGMPDAILLKPRPDDPAPDHRRGDRQAAPLCRDPPLDHPPPSRKLGWKGIPRRTGGRRHSVSGAHCRDLRCLRRDDERPSISSGAL
jgi:putative two-component system response regulator